MSITELITFLPFILAGMVGFGFLVGFHELGHFLFCKLFGVRTPSFSIGFGPQLFKKKIGDTVFTLSAIPGGGYVEIAGSEEPGQGEQLESKSMAPDSFAVKPYYQKMLIIAGGILFNLAFAYFAVSLALMIGAPTTELMSPQNIALTVKAVKENSAAEAAGVQVDDTIIALHTDVNSINQSLGSQLPAKFLEFTQSNPNLPVTLTIHRAGEVIEVPVTLADNNGRGALGVEFAMHELKVGFVDAIKMGVQQVNFWIYSTIDALTKLFKQKTVKGIGGPVMVISQMVKGAQKGFVVFLLFLAFISVNLAVMNLIPLPVFDGGQALFYTIEAIAGRPLPESVRNGIAYATWILLILLISWITLQDILVLIKPYLGL